MSRRETCFYHPDLRRIPPPEFTPPEPVRDMVNQWVRLELVDKRVFVGTLKALDFEGNMVLSNPVEQRPRAGKEDERKCHRGSLMFKRVEIERVAARQKELHHVYPEPEEPEEPEPEPEEEKTPERACGGCGAADGEKKLNACSRCQTVVYCSRECQLSDWKEHKTTCKKR